MRCFDEHAKGALCIVWTSANVRCVPLCLMDDCTCVAFLCCCCLTSASPSRAFVVCWTIQVRRVPWSFVERVACFCLLMDECECVVPLILLDEFECVVPFFVNECECSVSFFAWMRVRECSAFCFGRVTPRGGTRTLGSCATVLVVRTISVVASSMRLRCSIASGRHCGCEIWTRSRVKEGGPSCDDTDSGQDVEANVAMENLLSSR